MGPQFGPELPIKIMRSKICKAGFPALIAATATLMRVLAARLQPVSQKHLCVARRVVVTSPELNRAFDKAFHFKASRKFGLKAIYGCLLDFSCYL